MYNYNFKEEKIISEFVENLISINNKELRVNILITEENLLVFRNIKKDSILVGREIHEMPEYELIIKLPLNTINYKVDNENSIIKGSFGELIIFDLDLNQVKNS